MKKYETEVVVVDWKKVEDDMLVDLLALAGKYSKETYESVGHSISRLSTVMERLHS